MKIIKFKNGGELVKIDDHNWMCNNLPSRFGSTMSSYHLDECPDYPEDMIDDDTLKEEYGGDWLKFMTEICKEEGLEIFDDIKLVEIK